MSPTRLAVGITMLVMLLLIAVGPVILLVEHPELFVW